ncbi:MAG: hypothetical protein H7Y28_15240 [Rhodoferax sp.]|nr:hypothetical protein [Rhodoferax sp.]
MPQITRFLASTCLVLATVTSAVSAAQPLRVASWNLGWHVSKAELPQWLAQCGKTYQKDAADGVWKPAETGTVGWLIDEPRARVEGVDLSVMPPCGVFEGPDRQKLIVTPKAWAQRDWQIGEVIGKSIMPDVIAFQEVSGTQAVIEALGDYASQYRVCSHDGKFKVQRLAFAWKKELGEPAEACTAIEAISLPHLPPDQQVRPGFQMGLKVNGKLIRFLTLHLKAGCVSPLDRGKLDGNSGPNDPCPVLQQQVAPLEAALEKLGAGGTSFIAIGDFNRNLWHELHEVAGAKAVRSDGNTDLTQPLPANVLTQNFYKEINDGLPATSKATLVDMGCPGDAATQALCARSKTEAVPRRELAALGNKEALGCRNAVALDQVMVSDDLKAKVIESRKVSIGAFGRSAAPAEGQVDPVLGVSDHCPSLVTLRL